MEIDKEWIQENSRLFVKKRVVIIAGAGISVKGGIPDFRSKTGIFQDIKSKYKIKGQDLFTYKFGVDDSTRKIYIEYISALKHMVNTVRPTKTHKIIKWLKDKSEKMRVYTQNIDGLEHKAGMNEEVVYLHGNMNYLKCLCCGYVCDFTTNLCAALMEGMECRKCSEENKSRWLRPKKGYMHTNIIHYNQDHPESDKIAECIKEDSDCQVLIVVGTSLNVFGVRNMVKYFGSMENITSIHVNVSKCKSPLKKYFTHYYVGSSDSFFEAIHASIEEDEISVSIGDISICEETNLIKKDVIAQPSTASHIQKNHESRLSKKRKRLSLTRDDIQSSFLTLHE